MKTYETIGFILGAVAGGIATGISVYFTDNGFSGMICFMGAVIGGWIGRNIKKTKK